jgi:hypothetical protein
MPSATMSWLPEASATTASSAMHSANQPGSWSASATRPRAAPPSNWKATTARRLLGASSRKGLHKALKAQARPMTPVQRAIWSLGTPMLLSIWPATRATA